VIWLCESTRRNGRRPCKCRFEVDYLGIGKRAKEGDEKRVVMVSGKNRRRGEISSGVCRRRRVWLLALPQPPPLHLLHTDSPREEGPRGKNSYFLKRHDPLGLFVYSTSELM
jgi:hypothetical protein